MKTIEVPQSLADLLANPQRVRDAFALLNALAQVEVVLTTPGGSQPLTPGNQTIRGDPPTLTMPLPLRFTRSIPDSTATAASASATVNLLLAELRKVSQLPS